MDLEEEYDPSYNDEDEGEITQEDEDEAEDEITKRHHFPLFFPVSLCSLFLGLSLLCSHL